MAKPQQPTGIRSDLFQGTTMTPHGTTIFIVTTANIEEHLERGKSEVEECVAIL